MEVQHRVLYYDTDSVIYVWRPCQRPIETGDFLGEMTDELDGDTIEEFGHIPEVLGAHVPVEGESHVLNVKRWHDASFTRATKSNLEPRRRRIRYTLEMIKTLRKEE